MKSAPITFFLIMAFLLASCAPPPPPTTEAQPPAAATAPVAAATAAQTTTDTTIPAAPEAVAVDLTHLPIGDNKISSSPMRGYLWSCQTNFVPAEQAGASATGDWFNATEGTYNLTAKPLIDGQISWPHEFTITLEGTLRVIAGNDLPDHATGQYPVSAGDDAYPYDHNPNSISAQTMRLELPANPTVAAQASCAGGVIGVLLTGSYIFNAVDAGGRDAVAHEIQDSCAGHPQVSGVYHYHSVTPCLNDSGEGHSPLVGYAFDGFGLYGHHGQGGQELTNADLDECHGHTHAIEWDGQTVELYHYHATWEFPYTVGCYRATAVRVSTGEGGGPQDQGNGQPTQGQPGGQGQGPDLAVAAAKLNITEQQLRDALGPPPPDFAAAAAKLGVTEQQLREALGGP